nr:cation-transporting P-type ATPase [Erysipelothrix rhusiopathiae]
MSEIKKELIQTLQLNQEELFEQLDASPEGYTSNRAEEKLEEFGPNEIKPQKKKTLLLDSLMF